MAIFVAVMIGAGCSPVLADDVSDAIELLRHSFQCPIKPDFQIDFIMMSESRYTGDRSVFRLVKKESNRVGAPGNISRAQVETSYAAPFSDLESAEVRRMFESDQQAYGSRTVVALDVFCRAGRSCFSTTNGKATKTTVVVCDTRSAMSIKKAVDFLIEQAGRR